VNTDNAANRRPDGSLVQKSSGIQYCTELPKSKGNIANLSAKFRFSTVHFVRYKFLCKTSFGRYIRHRVDNLMEEGPACSTRYNKHGGSGSNDDVMI
jgi:hypothetical protein